MAGRILAGTTTLANAATRGRSTSAAAGIANTIMGANPASSVDDGLCTEQ